MSFAEEFMDYSYRVEAGIKQLERRLEAAEKSNDAKAQKMEHMQEEIDRCQAFQILPSLDFPNMFFFRLKSRNEELERALAELT
jgi:hypothetical protein